VHAGGHLTMLSKEKYLIILGAWLTWKNCKTTINCFTWLFTIKLYEPKIFGNCIEAYILFTCIRDENGSDMNGYIHMCYGIGTGPRSRSTTVAREQ
jgi:hypothetical protein